MYTNCAFVGGWESGVLELKTVFAENGMTQHEIFATSNIPRRPGVNLGPRKGDSDP